MSHEPLSPTDGTLIAAVLAGEKERFAELVQRYQSALRRAAISRLSRIEWADDVVQETFLCAFRWLHTYDSRYSFRTWLWTILLNQIHRHLKKQSRKPQVRSWTDQPATAAGNSHATTLEVAGHDTSPEARLLEIESALLLQSVLAQLPDVQADALRLRFFGELKFEEIAVAMGCSLSTAKNRVRWGLLKMSSLMRADERHRAAFDLTERECHEKPNEL